MNQKKLPGHSFSARQLFLFEKSDKLWYPNTKCFIAKGEIILKIQQSAEDYLETILMLSRKKPMIRSIDIVNELGFSKPSISIAMKNLRENGYISMDHDGYITLEPSGRHIAETIYERHTLLTELLILLGVSPETAAEDACRIEHVISPESFNAIKAHASAGYEKLKK